MTDDRLPHAEKTIGQNTTLAVFAGGTAEQSKTAAGGLGSQGYEPPVRRRSFGRWFGSTGWRHLIAIIVSIFAVFPILYVVSASLNPRGTLTGNNQLFSAIGFDSYVRILTDPQIPYPMWFLNTLIVATVTGVTMVIIGALAAYAF